MAAVKGDFEPPPAYTERMERQQALERKPKAKAPQEVAAPETQAQARIQDAVPDENAVLDAELAAMPPEQRADIEARAQAQRETFYKTGARFAPPLQVLVRNILRERAAERGPLRAAPPLTSLAPHALQSLGASGQSPP
jgi:hypothetical protein